MDKKKILIVDDEVQLVKMVQMRLEVNNYEVVTAHDGMEGIEKAKKENPDLILLDIMLPKMDGYKVCRLLKFDAKYKQIPIIMFSAKVQEKDVALGKEVGADAYVTKPFKVEDLLGQIKKLLGEQSEQSA
jgi:two-component system alkaline phosphatase synthesis response regulator PhoP